MARVGGQGRTVGFAAVLVAVLGAVIWALWGQGGGSAVDEAETAAPAPAAAPDPAAAPALAPALAPAPPRFDVVRVDGSGLATIAGTAPPEAGVSLRLDGVEIATARADGAGQFAALVTLPPSQVPRLMGLVAVLADGTELAGAETVAIGPVAAPVVAVEAVGAPVVTADVPPALLISDAGAVVLQAPSAAPEPVAPQAGKAAAVSIEAISYGAAGEVLLSGHASPGAALRIYVDDAPLADLVAGADGRWQARLPEVAPGLHRLRADALDAGGKVLARFETPFQREVPVVVAAAPAEPAPIVAPAPITITVQPGLTLWAIARENFGDGVMYVQVFEANRDKIKDPDLIYPGQVFTGPKP